MRKLPVIPQNETPEQRKLRRRIALANRPRLDVGLARLDEVSSVLAKNGDDRSRFIQNPTSYLQAQALPVSSCNLVQASPARTSEVCSVVVACNVNSAVNVNVGININVGMNMNIVTSIYVYTSVRFFGYQEMDSIYRAHNDQSPSLYNSGIL